MCGNGRGGLETLRRDAGSASWGKGGHPPVSRDGFHAEAWAGYSAALNAQRVGRGPITGTIEVRLQPRPRPPPPPRSASSSATLRSRPSNPEWIGPTDER